MMMHKLSAEIGGNWVEHTHDPVFRIEGEGEAPRRLVVGVPKGNSAIFRALSNLLTPPYFLLYVLHTSRGEGDLGRYQSPALERSQFNAVIDSYSPLLSGDGRHNIWAHSPGDNATVVWDHHNLIFAYGPIDQFAVMLRDLGFEKGDPAIPFPHQHHYRAEFDGDATAILSALEWSRSPLHPSEVQWAES